MPSAKNAKSHIAYYVTSHGYGHGVRSTDIIRALNQLYPELGILIVSDLPISFFENRLGEGPYLVRSGSFDVGMVQLDSIRVDVRETLVKVLRLYDRRNELVKQETEFLRSNAVGLVVVDIPGMPLESAEILGIPGIAVGNFSWDWIYSAFIPGDPRWSAVVRYFKEAYSRSNLLLRLPFSAEMGAFPHIEDIPLVASPGRSRRQEIAALTGADPGKKWILLSFTSLDWDEAAIDKVERLNQYEFFTVLPLEWRRSHIRSVDRDRVRFPDIVASMDGVITKPGFGILSDCLVNGKPVIYVDRSDFSEYEVLEAAIRKYFKHCHIPVRKLYQGDVEEAIEKLWSQPEPKMSIPGG
ncbi:MAG TPA: hypothetical protein VE398_10405 [Acidobacteriota bacterium]|nr:hypothetical protein [Acidobacteriota bacterium]